MEGIEKGCERVLCYTRGGKVKRIETMVKRGDDKLALEKRREEMERGKNDNG